MRMWCGEAERGVFEEDFEVEEILSAWGPPERRFFLVKWAGWDIQDATYEPLRHLRKAHELIDEFWLQHRELNKQDTIETGFRNPPEIGKWRCVWCCKFYARAQDLKGHQTKASNKGGCKCKPGKRAGTKTEAAVLRQKQIALQASKGQVYLGYHLLKNCYTAKYLGFVFQANGDLSHAMQVRMAQARGTFNKLHEIWRRGGASGKTLRCPRAPTRCPRAPVFGDYPARRAGQPP